MAVPKGPGWGEGCLGARLVQSEWRGVCREHCPSSPTGCLPSPLSCLQGRLRGGGPGFAPGFARAPHSPTQGAEHWPPEPLPDLGPALWPQLTSTCPLALTHRAELPPTPSEPPLLTCHPLHSGGICPQAAKEVSLEALASAPLELISGDPPGLSIHSQSGQYPPHLHKCRWVGSRAQAP